MDITTGQLLRLFQCYVEHDGRSPTTISRLASGSGVTIARVADGRAITNSRIKRIAGWLSDRWPADLPWPADIPRAPAGDDRRDEAA